MTRTATLPNHLRPKRQKVFGTGTRVTLDREAKNRIKVHARALMQRTQAGTAYGVVTAKALAVLDALLWGFHNAADGRCDPSYETIAKRAGCARSTVALAIKALELAGVLTWDNRLTRIREAIPDLFGKWAARWRLIRISNAYRFIDPVRQAFGLNRVSSKSENRTGTAIQESYSSIVPPSLPLLDPENPLERALLSLGRHIGAIPRTAV